VESRKQCIYYLLVFVRFFFSQIINRSGIKDMKMFTYIMNGVN